MKKKIIVSLIMSAVVLLSGCGKTEITYSNLADQETREEVVQILEEGKLPKEQVQKVMKWAEEFNGLSKSYDFPKGFQKLPEKGLDYSSLMMDDSAASYEYLQWLNCRLTAFTLLKDQIQTEGKGNDEDIWLMFDREAIDTVPEYKVSSQDKDNFLNVFNQVSVAGTSSVEEHVEKIKEAWKNRKIKIQSENVSLISVYIHAPEDEARFVGHTGVLVETKNDLVFIEKYSNIAPFQVTRFSNREELKKYLLARADLYGDEKELEPIVMENGEVLP